MIALELAKPQPSSTTLSLKFAVGRKELKKLKQLKELLSPPHVHIDDDNTIVICCDGAGYSLSDRIAFMELLRLAMQGKAKLVHDYSEHYLFAPVSDYGATATMFSSFRNEYISVYLIGLHLDPCPARCPMCYLASTWSRFKLPNDINKRYDHIKHQSIRTYRHVKKLIDSIIDAEYKKLQNSDRHYTSLDIYIAYTTPDITTSTTYYNIFWQEMEHHLHLRGYQRLWGFDKKIETDQKMLSIHIYPVVSTTPWHRDTSSLFNLDVDPAIITLTHEPRQFKLDYYDYNDALKEKIRELRKRYRHATVVVNTLMYRYYSKQFNEWYTSDVPTPEVISETSYIQLVSYHPEPNRLGWQPPTQEDILRAINDVLEYAPVDKLILDASTTVRLFKQQPDVVSWVHRMERERYYRCTPQGCVNNLVCPRDSNRCLALET